MDEGGKDPHTASKRCRPETKLLKKKKRSNKESPLKRCARPLTGSPVLASRLSHSSNRFKKSPRALRFVFHLRTPPAHIPRKKEKNTNKKALNCSTLVSISVLPLKASPSGDLIVPSPHLFLLPSECVPVQTTRRMGTPMAQMVTVRLLSSWPFETSPLTSSSSHRFREPQRLYRHRDPPEPSPVPPGDPESLRPQCRRHRFLEQCLALPNH